MNHEYKPWSGHIGAPVSSLKQQRAALHEQAMEISQRALDEKREPTAREVEDVDRLLEQIAGYDERIKYTGEERAVSVRGSGGTGNEFDPESRVLGPERRMTDYVREHAARFNANLDYEGLDVGTLAATWMRGRGPDIAKRALSEGIDSQGGVTVPTLTSMQSFDLLRPRSVVFRAGARTIPLETDTTVFAKLASDPSFQWLGENASMSSTGGPTFSSVTFQPLTLRGVFRASRELVEDAQNLEEMINRSVAGAFASELDRVALVGSSTAGEPVGLSNSTGINIVSLGTTGAGAAITSYSPLVDAWKALEESNAGFDVARDPIVLAPRTRAQLTRLASTGDGQPLGKPDILDGARFLVSSQVPINQAFGSSTNLSTIYWGDWSDMVVGMRSQIRLEPLRERYADNFQFGFLSFMRVDIELAHDQSFARVQRISS